MRLPIVPVHEVPGLALDCYLAADLPAAAAGVGAVFETSSSRLADQGVMSGSALKPRPLTLTVVAK